jgi:hypothetical protein
VAFAGAIMSGLATSIELLSLHAAEFGVGMMAIPWLMLVLSSSVTGDWSAPGGGLAGMSGVESGNAEASVSAIAGADVHEPAWVELPSGAGAGTVPVALALRDPSTTAGTVGGRIDEEVVLVTAVFGIVGVDAVVIMLGLNAAIALPAVVVLANAAIEGVTPSTDGEIACAAEGEQFTLVPAIVGSCASGTGAKVVTGVFCSVAAEKKLEKGLGPFRGDETMAPGVVGRPIAVVPIVETCARQLPLPSRRANSAYSRYISARLRTDRNRAAVGKIDCRVEDNLITGLEVRLDFDLLAEIAFDRDLLHVNPAIPHHSNMQAVLIKHDRVSGHHKGGGLSRDMKINDAINSGAEGTVGVRNIDLGQQCPAARLQRASNAGYLARKVAIWNFRNVHDSVDSRLNSVRFILGYIKLHTDHIAVHHREHQG